MKSFIIALFCIVAIAVYSCKKETTGTTSTDTTLEGQVLTDFSNVLVNPDYQDIQTKAGIMRDAAATLIANTTDANLAETRTAWKNTRGAWESCEGFLFGPVEDFNYDPNMDDWPVNKVDLDSLLASNNSLSVENVTSLGTTLKGFHAIEYIIFGVGSTKKASQITAREKVYLASLTQSLYSTTTQLRNSWDPAVTGNFTLQVINAGKGSVTFTSRKAVFLALVGSMADICNEVANEKMQTPLAAQDSTLDESSFSHNSVTDFTNNITGVKNAYFSSYNGASGHSLSELVKAKNASLDNKLQSQISSAIASFNGITATYEKAIYTQQNQIKTTQAAIRTLKATIEGDLADFINANIKD
ncbi:imelysin family protein [Mucilaginibacter sp.]|uniref:imelysin family protein n=1 Tax=Mucilaginibacter sp. TaxID=1882438 RepID=UPI003D0E062A